MNWQLYIYSKNCVISKAAIRSILHLATLPLANCARWWPNGQLCTCADCTWTTLHCYVHSVGFIWRRSKLLSNEFFLSRGQRSLQISINSVTLVWGRRSCLKNCIWMRNCIMYIGMFNFAFISLELFIVYALVNNFLFKGMWYLENSKIWSIFSLPNCLAKLRKIWPWNFGEW